MRRSSVIQRCLFGVSLILALFIGWSLHNVQSSHAFVNGDADDVTPLPGMQSLYTSAGQPKQSWIVAGAGHAQSFATDTADYKSRVDAFFDTYLSRA